MIGQLIIASAEVGACFEIITAVGLCLFMIGYVIMDIFR